MFPSHYPASCPPSDAIEPDGEHEYFRAVAENVSLEDVRSQFELGLPHSDSCEDRGLSFYKGPRGVERLISSYQWAAGKKVARLRIKKEWGLLRTGSPRAASTHTNFWLYAATDKSEVVRSLVVLK